MNRAAPPRSFRSTFAFTLAACVVLASSSPLQSQPSAAPADAGSEPRAAEARAHFERGIAHFDRQEWQAALVEFLQARELFETKGNTKNAAICLRKVERYDEALALFQRLLTFPDLSADERTMVELEIAELNESVGALELRGVPAGAAVSVDGVMQPARALGQSWLVRVSAGPHQLRVTREGALPFERRVDVAGSHTTRVEVALTALTRAGRLRVREQDDRPLELVIDNERVGSTPWEGALAPGVHTLQSRGSGTLGTQPQQISVARDELREVVLVARELAGPLSIRVEPARASLWLDGVPLGQGSWQGGVLSGAHRVESRLEGYRAELRTPVVDAHAPHSLSLRLEPIARARSFALELRSAMALGLRWAGSVQAECGGGCAASVPLGGAATLHVRYQGAAGFGAGLGAGYLGMRAQIEQRRALLAPVGLPVHTGRVDDRLRLDGLLLGADADFTFGTRWPLILRLGAGALLGSLRDQRTGRFTDSGGTPYDVEQSVRASARYLYVAPELNIARALGAGLSASLGLQLLILTALHAPTWDAEQGVLVGDDGLGYFDDDSLTGRVLIVALPSLGLRYAF